MDFNEKQKSQKMEKTRFYIMALLVVFMGMAVSSCSSDDDDVSPIVGTWEKTTTSGGIVQFVFNSDNTGSSSITENGSEHRYYFIYKYNESDSSIIITFEDGSGFSGTAKINGSYLIMKLKYGTSVLQYTLKKK